VKYGKKGDKYGGMIWVNDGGGTNRGRHKIDPKDTEWTLKIRVVLTALPKPSKSISNMMSGLCCVT